MALTGDLQDIGLVNLVQMLCLDQRQAMLRLKRHGLEEGLIYFADGQIVHALAGPDTGPEAVYKLLGWAEGSFKVTEAITPPHQTVAAPWNALLMEGMRLVDEQKLDQAAQPDKPLTAAEIEQDNLLEHSLIQLLSNLEQLQTKLADPKVQKRPVQALQTLTELVNEVAAFCETQPSQASLSEALASLTEKYTVIQLLRVHHNRLSTDIVTKLYESWSEDVSKRRETFTEIGHSLLDVLETYFTHLTIFFHASALVNQWQEMCQIFLAELKQAVQKIQF